jgi:hypothetical protein
MCQAQHAQDEVGSGDACCDLTKIPHKVMAGSLAASR